MKIQWLARIGVLMITSWVSMASVPSHAKVAVDGDGNTAQDEYKAEQYFRHNDDGAGGGSSSGSGDREPSSLNPDQHYLALHLGAFLSNDAWKWEDDHQTNVGRLNIGVTYLLANAGTFGDWLLRAEYQSFQFPDGNPSQIVFSPMFTFPDATSKFPLYFGASAGLGVFVQQIDGSSPLSFDYSLIAGARLFNVIDETGFFMEGGIKNAILLTSQGQFNGFFFAIGAIFTF